MSAYLCTEPWFNKILQLPGCFCIWKVFPLDEVIMVTILLCLCKYSFSPASNQGNINLSNLGETLYILAKRRMDVITVLISIFFLTDKSPSYLNAISRQTGFFLKISSMPCWWNKHQQLGSSDIYIYLYTHVHAAEPWITGTDSNFKFIFSTRSDFGTNPKRT